MGGGCNHLRALGEVGGAVDGGAHAEHAAGLLGDLELVARDHLDADAQRVGELDGLLRVGARRVEEGDQTHEAPATVETRRG